MYCRRCGKKIDYAAEICLECQREVLSAEATSSAEENGGREAYRSAHVQPARTGDPVPQADFAPAAKPTSRSNPDSRQGRALASTVMGVAAALVSYCCFIAAIVLSGGVGSDLGRLYFYQFWIGATAMGVVALVFGIKSIVHYNKCRAQCGKKYVATLVLGIVGLVSSSIALLLSSLIINFFI